jgi:hypothetical protein
MLMAIAAVACLIPLWPVIPYPAGVLPPTPRFFTGHAVKEIPPGATTMVLPIPGYPHVDAMVWQARAHLRFNMVGGYSIFRRGDGGSTFFPPLPYAWTILRRVSMTATQPNEAQITAASESLRSYNIRYVIVTSFMRNMTAVERTVNRIAQCHTTQIDDVGVCHVGRTL